MNIKFAFFQTIQVGRLITIKVFVSIKIEKIRNITYVPIMRIPSFLFSLQPLQWIDNTLIKLLMKLITRELNLE
jgi:hypothetical protein